MNCRDGNSTPGREHFPFIYGQFRIWYDSTNVFEGPNPVHSSRSLSGPITRHTPFHSPLDLTPIWLLDIHIRSHIHVFVILIPQADHQAGEQVQLLSSACPSPDGQSLLRFWAEGFIFRLNLSAYLFYLPSIPPRLFQISPSLTNDDREIEVSRLKPASSPKICMHAGNSPSA